MSLKALIYLLPHLLLMLVCSASYSIQDGDFEQVPKVFWNETNNHGSTLVLNSVSLLEGITPHSGNRAVWLVGDNNEISSLSQTIYVPTDANFLNYFYWIRSDELASFCGKDQAYVRLDGSTLITYNLCEITNTNQWVHGQIDISTYQGRTVDLTFGASTDSAVYSDFFLDDVSINLTVGLPGAFSKSTPANGTHGQSDNLTLTWGTSNGATSYEYCYDTTNNSSCDGNWVSTGSNLNVGLSGLSVGTTYYWHARARNAAGTTDANAGTWWSFIIKQNKSYLYFPILLKGFKYRPNFIALPKTGQTIMFKPGDDGDLEIGQAWPNPRFIVGNGVQEDCILDRLTGLNWARSFSGQYGSWFIDIEIVNNMSLRGFNDWRLPNVTEMSSLFNFGVTRIYDWLRDQGFQFPCIGCATSTTYPSETGKFYYSNFDIVNIESFPKSLNYHFLPVRGGQKEISDPHYPGNVWKTGQTLTYYDRDDGDLKMGVSWPNPRFTDNGDGTITDLFTSLMWSKNANCLKTQYPDFDNDGSQGDGGISWNHAFDFMALLPTEWAI